MFKALILDGKTENWNKIAKRRRKTIARPRILIWTLTWLSPNISLIFPDLVLDPNVHWGIRVGCRTLEGSHVEHRHSSVSWNESPTFKASCLLGLPRPNWHSTDIAIRVPYTSITSTAVSLTFPNALPGARVQVGWQNRRSPTYATRYR